MKITISELRKLIRETIDQEADVPGRWRANTSGEAIGDDDLDRLGHHGHRSGMEDMEEIEEMETESGTVEEMARRIVQDFMGKSKK
jgi:hypothetical protein